MPKSIVGRVENQKFAFFWLLIGGSIGNVILVLYSIEVWPVFLPQAILSVLMAIAMMGKKKRPKVWLGADLVFTLVLSVLLLSSYGAAGINFGIFLPNLLILSGCVLGIMNW